MIGEVAALEGLHVTGKFRDKNMTHTSSRHAAWDPHTFQMPRGTLNSSPRQSSPNVCNVHGPTKSQPR